MGVMKTIRILVVGIIIGITLMLIINTINQNKFNNLNVIGQLQITGSFINVREDHYVESTLITEVTFNEKYDFIETFEGTDYTWYKIKYSIRKTGWIASLKSDPWIQIIKGGEE